MKILLENCKQNREKWLALRRLGCSDAPAICEINPWVTPHQVWLEKMGLSEPFTGNETTEWGNLLEPVIAQRFAEDAVLPITLADCLIEHPLYPYITGTPDYFVGDDTTPLEVKNVGGRLAEHWRDAPPPYVQVQVQMQMELCEADHAYVVAQVGGRCPVWFRVDRDDASIAICLERMHQFNEYIETSTPPPMDAGDNDLLADMWVPEDIEILLPPDALLLVENIDALDEELAGAAKEKKRLQAEIKLMMGKATEGVADGRRVTWKADKKGTRRFLISKKKETNDDA